jgi:hypothetical protein
VDSQEVVFLEDFPEDFPEDFLEDSPEVEVGWVVFRLIWVPFHYVQCSLTGTRKCYSDNKNNNNFYRIFDERNERPRNQGTLGRSRYSVQIS